MDTEIARQEFAQRLLEVCNDKKLPERGRLKQLGKLFGVSYQAAKRWLDAETFPQTETLLAIAEWGQVNVNWLLQGVGPKRAAPPEATVTAAEGINQLPDDDKLQVIDYMRFKFHARKGWFAEESLARYDAALDELGKKRH